MNRVDLQQLAEIRLADAEALLAAGRWAGAFYMLGYVVECALKASIAAQLGPEEIPDRKLVNEFYTHRLDGLLKISPLRPTLELRRAEGDAFDAHWNSVQNWTEASRYQCDISEEHARHLYTAITNANAGVYTWLKARC